LLITPTGQVHGNIAVRSLHIEEGGTLQGECHMGETPTGAPASSAGNGFSRPPPPPIGA
jgi:cytoskeletal protein CcmA (bactofilin family)